MPQCCNAVGVHSNHSLIFRYFEDPSIAEAVYIPRNMSVKGILNTSEISPKNDKKGEFTKLLGDIVASIHKRADTYFWKLIGDSPECLSTLLDCEKHLMTHILGKCDLYDEDNKRYTNGIKDSFRRFAPCEITWNK